MESHFQARKYRAMNAVADALEEDHPQYGLDAAAAEIQCALHLTRRATETELFFALELQRRLPGVWAALVTGAIDVRRARTITRATGHLSAAVAQDVVERIIEAAPNFTTGELKARIERMVIDADPDGAQERYEYAVKGRRLIAESTSDGTGHLLGLDLPPHPGGGHLVEGEPPRQESEDQRGNPYHGSTPRRRLPRSAPRQHHRQRPH
jgi:hypothetical protein